MDEILREPKPCCACGGKMEFVQEVLLGQAGFLFPDPVRADLYLCPDCRRLDVYECVEDGSLERILSERRRQQERLEDEAAELVVQAQAEPVVESKGDPWQEKGLFRRRKKPDWEK